VLASEYLRQQAQTLAAMSRATFDLGMAGRLRGMASDFDATAAEMEQHTALAPEREDSEANQGSVASPRRVRS